MRFILASVHVLLGLFALSGARPTPLDSETKNSLEIPRSTESNSPTDVMKSASSSRETPLRKDIYDLTHIFTANHIFEITDGDLKGMDKVELRADDLNKIALDSIGRTRKAKKQGPLNLQATLMFKQDWPYVTRESPLYLSAGAYGISTTLLLLQLAQIGVQNPPTTVHYSLTLYTFNLYSAFSAKESGFEFKFRGSDSKTYFGSVGPCRDDCKNPSGEVDLIIEAGSTEPKRAPIFRGTVLQEPKGKDVLGKCRSYLEAAFNDPDTYFVPPSDPKKGGEGETKLILPVVRELFGV
ncbi:hypothetical protein F5880DRAFT_1593412 [Lentinula raphanica]|nr:hypothetical protein F5880DRAFT_1593412 [Lentinula raphanica]